MTTDSRAYLGNLHRLLDQHFDLEDVRTLCVHLGVDYDSVRGEGKSARVRELIVALARNGRLQELLALVEVQRPHIQWPPIPSDFQLPASLDSSTATASIQHVYLGDVIHGDRIDGDRVSVGHISDSQGIAIGREAGAKVEHQAKNVADKLASIAPSWWPGNPHYFAPGVAVSLFILIVVILVVSLRPEQPEGLVSSPPEGTNPTSVVEVVTSPSITPANTVTTPLTPVETATVTPTPPTTSETRPPDVIIAEFETRPGETVRVARRLEENLHEQLQRYGLRDVNVRVVNEPILDREQAEALTTELAGKVLIWGWYDDVGVRVRIHLPESNQDSLQAMRLRELPLAQADSGSNELAFLINGPLPQNVTFLSLFIIGQLRYQANEYQAGYAAFDAAMANLPETVIFENEALLHFFRARQLEHSGEDHAVEVICDYARAIVLDPGFAPAYNNLGVFLASHQLPSEVNNAVEPCLMELPFDYSFSLVETLFRRGAELQPESVLSAYNLLAWDYYLFGHKYIPVEAIDEMITRDPSLPGPYILSGVFAVQENDLAKAEARFKAVLEQLPELRLNLALVYLLQDRLQDARLILEEMLVTNSADAEVLLALAYLAYQQEGVDPAQYYLEQISPLEQIFPVTMPTTTLEPLSLPDGFHEAGYVTSPIFMAELFRSFLLFETGDIVGAIAELENLVLTTERVFETRDYSALLPIERYLLSLLYASIGNDEAAQDSWEAISPLDTRYTVTAQAATAKAWNTLEVTCSESPAFIGYWSTPDWLTLDNSCLPESLDERIEAVFALFVERLPGRISHQTSAFFAGGGG